MNYWWTKAQVNNIISEHRLMENERLCAVMGLAEVLSRRSALTTKCTVGWFRLLSGWFAGFQLVKQQGWPVTNMTVYHHQTLLILCWSHWSLLPSLTNQTEISLLLTIEWIDDFFFAKIMKPTDFGYPLTFLLASCGFVWSVSTTIGWNLVQTRHSCSPKDEVE